MFLRTSFEIDSTPDVCAYIFLRVTECRSLFRSVAKQQVIVINVARKKSNENHTVFLKNLKIPRLGDLYRYAKELSSDSTI